MPLWLYLITFVRLFHVALFTKLGMSASQLCESVHRNSTFQMLWTVTLVKNTEEPSVRLCIFKKKKNLDIISEKFHLLLLKDCRFPALHMFSLPALHLEPIFVPSFKLRN